MHVDLRIHVIYDGATVSDRDELERILQKELERFVADGGLTPPGSGPIVVDEYSIHIRMPRGPFGKKKLEKPEGELKTYAIWSEGYRATGESAGAHFHGHGEGTSFKDACKRFFDKPEHAVRFSALHMTYWGCRLFDNESDARETFG